MDSELLQSFVGQSNEEEQEPSRLYQKQDNKDKKRDVHSVTPSTPQPGGYGRNRKNVVIIEQRKFTNRALALDECKSLKKLGKNS